MWYGIITYNEAVVDKKFLEELGVIIKDTKLKYYGRLRMFDAQVEVPDKVFDKLDPHWGRLIWTLEHKEEDS